jgi:type I restriction enzyme, S subunit
MIGKLNVAYNHPFVRQKLNKLENGPFPLNKLISVLSSAKGIRYGVSTPPPILMPSETTVPFIRATNIKNGEILTEKLLHIDANQNERMQKCLLEAGEMILVRSGVNTGDCAVVPDLLAGSYAAYDLILNFTDDVIPLFISTFLDTKVGRIQLNVLKDRAAQSHLNAEEVSSILIPKPPIEIQRSLVAAIEAARQIRKKKLAQADELLSSINDYFLIQLGLSPLSILNASIQKVQGFAVKRSDVRRRLDTLYHKPEFCLLEKQLSKSGQELVLLKNLSTSFTNGDHGGLEYTESGVRYLRGQSVTPHRLDLTDELYISLEDHERMIRSEVIPGDVLLTIAGSIGNCCVVRNIDQANINQAIVKIRPMPSIDSDYLAAFLNSDYGRFQTRRLANGAVQLNVNFSEVGDIQVLVPDLAAQRSLVIEIEKRRADAQRLRQEAEAEWEAAKTRFERQLLGEVDP